MLYGISYSEFWEMCPKDLEPFSKAFDMRAKYNDEQLWVQGMYIKLAIASSLSEKVKYPDVPFMAKTVKPKQDVIKERFLNRMAIINRQFKEG